MVQAMLIPGIVCPLEFILFLKMLGSLMALSSKFTEKGMVDTL